MKNLFSKMGLLVGLSLALVACNTDQEDDQLPHIAGTAGAYVLNQGNQGNGIDGKLTYVDFEDMVPVHNLFQSANGKSMGMSPQDGVIYGSKLYIAVHGSNTVWAIDRSSRKILGQIATNAPQGLAAVDGAIYVANNDGYVTKIDTTALKVVTKTEVGPNPVDIEARNGYLYVSISDGYNFGRGYENGFRLAKVSLSNFSKVGDVKVGMNPGKMTQDRNGNIFVVCNGDYQTILPTIYRVAIDDKASEYAEGNIIAAHGDQLFVANHAVIYDKNWKVTSQKNEYYVMNTKDHQKVTGHLWAANKVKNPIALNINPNTGELFLTSRNDKNEVSANGQLTVFDRLGALKNTIGMGVEPYAVIFDIR
ncbi:MAG: hypothetical protein HUK09_09625 [Bacteroidaceae bacterium]|nr:hypothetical protein [Bacteroidaceae bacterium]